MLYLNKIAQRQIPSFRVFTGNQHVGFFVWCDETPGAASLWSESDGIKYKDENQQHHIELKKKS